MPTQTEVAIHVPKYRELMFPCLKALKALGGSGTNEEILDKVCDLEGYSDDRARRSEDQIARLIWVYSSESAG